ncbi:hypothetical protein C8N25_101219 [Algoriphagus antarcticus]|uniref:Uncharacterized protein n=1 Tax=Algoriphagus antarcticus TaxID=238540 RepID=A0A3E0E823_9BACT|nr:hypothetical protein C8N25_101219 [Algoriphagus antarcticus]
MIIRNDDSVHIFFDLADGRTATARQADDVPIVIGRGSVIA